MHARTIRVGAEPSHSVGVQKKHTFYLIFENVVKAAAFDLRHIFYSECMTKQWVRVTNKDETGVFLTV